MFVNYRAFEEARRHHCTLFEKEDDATLSGAPQVINVEIDGETYYYKAYPTKT